MMVLIQFQNLIGECYKNISYTLTIHPFLTWGGLTSHMGRGQGTCAVNLTTCEGWGVGGWMYKWCFFSIFCVIITCLSESSWVYAEERKVHKRPQKIEKSADDKIIEPDTKFVKLPIGQSPILAVSDTWSQVSLSLSDLILKTLSFNCFSLRIGGKAQPRSTQSGFRRTHISKSANLSFFLYWMNWQKYLLTLLDALLFMDFKFLINMGPQLGPFLLCMI